MRFKRRKADHDPTVWTKVEEQKIFEYLKNEEYDINELQHMFPKRTTASIKNKSRKLRVKYDLFGSKYREEKEQFTERIAKNTRPQVVFDAYAGSSHQTQVWIKTARIVYAAEKNHTVLALFRKNIHKAGYKKEKSEWEKWERFKKGNKEIRLFAGDAIKAAAKLCAERIIVDLVDLDTCGSTIPTIPTFLVLLRPKHLVITYGEFHSFRFGREDVLRRLLCHKDIRKKILPLDAETFPDELDIATKAAALRAHNETKDSFWLEKRSERWLGAKFHSMLRRYYKVTKPPSTADCLNRISG